ncbi:MAG TPA: hypothetical protein VMD28_06940, partial [Acidimicrobiales bacterium]|nr:hypothetical protein [Acidimicrobiales bacterium]
TATNDVRAQVIAMRDLGALPGDVDIDRVIADLGLDQPVRDPTTMDAEQLTSAIREMTKSLLGYGARMPKALMLFVKDMLFIDNAMAIMAPDVDVLAQTVAILTQLQSRHGDQIARDLGVAETDLGSVDLAGVRSSFGLTAEVEHLSHRDLQARRRLIRRRLQHRDGPKGTLGSEAEAQAEGEEASADTKADTNKKGLGQTGNTEDEDEETEHHGTES